MFLYRLVLTIFSPLILIWIGVRRARGRENAETIRERLGGCGGPGPTIWIHGASLGEMMAARHMIEALRARVPEMNFVVTTNSTTGRAMVEGWNDPCISARLAPLDYRAVVSRFLRAWSPVALISMENELWPNRTAVCAARGIPVLAAAARISDGSAVIWRRWPGLAAAVMPLLSWIGPQDSQSAARFRSLGVTPDRIAVVMNLKSGVALPQPDPDALAGQLAVMPRAQTVLAASTHPGEDALVLDAYRLARRDRPDLRLIIAPRHPDRGPAIADQIRAAGLRLTQRSAGQSPDAESEVLLADTLGEMSLWYSAAAVTFVGGSLIDYGGHTPYEPAQFNSAIIHGPYVENHAAFATLDANAGAILVEDAVSLARAFVELSVHRRQQDMVGKARDSLQAETSMAATLEPMFSALAALTDLPTRAGP